ncbi:MAG: FG-GAP repeat protein [Thermoanaerobaculales bacterium]|nr:FG-GAP repeat protein [Thermoanaerobaculales bacterium]
MKWTRIRIALVVIAVLMLAGSWVDAQEPDGPAVFEQQLLAGDPGDGDNFGVNVAIDGDTAVVGAYGKDLGILPAEIGAGAA